METPKNDKPCFARSSEPERSEYQKHLERVAAALKNLD